MRIHFIGIGGIGVSALAQYYLAKGCKVSGSDLVSSEITNALSKKGAKLLIGKHKAKNVSKDVDMVVYSPAVSKDNPELKKAQSLISYRDRARLVRQLEIKSYPQALGELTKKYFTIAVSGTHGKSTTTAMIGLILAKAGLDPTVIVGTKVKEFASHQKNGGGSNCRVGKSKYLVIEADEHLASFLNYWPKIIVITNIEADHLDYYKNIKNIEKAFDEFVSHLPKDGILIKNSKAEPGDSRARWKKRTKFSATFKIQKSKLQFKIQNYNLKKPDAAKLRKILKVPGEHNIANALAALTVARALKIPDKISFKALSEYKGSWRRFEIKKMEIRNWKLDIISDYAHHPTEIRVTLKAAREKYPKKKIWCIYQPHQYQRTYYLLADFVKVFRQTPIEKIIITDIYDVAGREESKIKKKVSSEKLVKMINKKEVIYLPKEKIINYLKKNIQGREVIIIMGAGDIYNIALNLTEKK